MASGLTLERLKPTLAGVVFTESVRMCRDALREASRLSDGPIERHSGRVFFIMDALSARASLQIDREVAACAAMLHDIGLYHTAARPRLYLHHGRVVGEQVIESFSWSDDRKKTCLDAIELHHRLTPQWDIGIEVELLRLADLVDASRGIVSFGLDPTWVRTLFQAIERKGLQRELLRHSIRGAPCMTRGMVGTIINAPRQGIPRKASSGEPSN